MARFRRTHTRALFESSWLTLSQHTVEDHDGVALPHPVYTLDIADWVNVVALTHDGCLVLVRQHRFGTQSDSLEIPGGLVDPGESPLDAARRELAEETGYTSERWEALGWTFPNPALQQNKLYTFVARDAERTQEVSLDLLEDCRVELLPYDALPAVLSRGEIRHALVRVALYELLLRDQGLKVSAP